MTPEESRALAVTILHSTMEAANSSDWIIDADGIPLAEPCEIQGQDGVAFSLGARSASRSDDPTSDVERVVEYWQSIGITSRVVSQPVPRAFGVGGPIKAISFSTAPTYAVSVSGECVPGDAFDYYDDYRAPSPTP